MSRQYTLKVISDFAAAHALRGYPGECRNLHGHNWKVEVEISAQQLDELGMAIDFKTIKQLTRMVTDELDHKYLNDIPPFDTINPTAENLAAYIFRRLKAEVESRGNSPHLHVSAITLWETERASVRYSED